MSYQDFLASKAIVFKPSGIQAQQSNVHDKLFDFQKDLVTWAVRKGRAAIFADTGLGKTFMQLEWARLIGERCLIVAPLSVARQTVNEARKIDIEVHYTRSGEDIMDGINITNYEMLDHFDAAAFGAVVLDESSILKGLASKTRQKLIDQFRDMPYKLCCTATPAPNDIAEISNHAEFLGIMRRVDMLASFFVHDDNGWRLKGHAEQPFYRWMASWGMSVRKPSDLGYDDDGFALPPLSISPLFVKTDFVPEGQLMFTGLKGITSRSEVRRATMMERVSETAELVNGNDDQWIVWCGLNDEQDAIARLVPDSVSVYGNQSIDAKIDAIDAFLDGSARVLITKVSIAGFGMNFQNSHNMVFLGLNDSWEQYYQAIRRQWRFGQTEPVNVHIVLADIEDAIYQNIQEKEARANQMTQNLIDNVQEYEREELSGATIGNWQYSEDVATGDGWEMKLGDSVERLAEIEPESVGLSVFSPPFISLYTYSPTDRDIGNSRTENQFFGHFQYIIQELFRVTMPGRNCAVHVADVPALLVRDGYIGLKDFPGMTIRAFEDHGWIYHGRVTIDKDPQAQAIRTHSKALLFNQLKKDSAWSRPALADYILIFRKPGDNPVPVKPDITNEMWIEWARPIWYGIRESDTLQYTTARSDKDERHICPLQLGTIERCIRLWSNPGELILSPFAGIGSEGYVALQHGRRFVGIELKPEYWQVACRNLAEAERKQNEQDLFAMAGVVVG